METIGLIGSLLLAICGLPQAVKSIIVGNSDGISWLFLASWGIGEICVLVYIIPLDQIPLIINYSANILFVAIITFYKVNPRRDVEKRSISLGS